MTVCTKRRGLTLAEVERGLLVLTPLGSVADFYWRQIPVHFPHVALDEYTVMPDHVHGVLRFVRWPGRRPGAHAGDVHGIQWATPCRGGQLTAPTGGGPKAPLTHGRYADISPGPGSLPVVMRTWKGAVRQWANDNGEAFAWQRGYYDHVIRDPVALWRIRRYIRQNPAALLRGMHPEDPEKEAQWT